MGINKRLIGAGATGSAGGLVPSEHFGVVLYEGDGSSSHSINGGKFGAGAYFNGSSSQITTSNDIPLEGEFAISLWVNQSGSDYSSGSYLFDFGYNSSPYMFAWIQNGTIRFDDNTAPTGRYSYSTATTSNAWNHIVITRNSSNTTSFYLNGSLDGTSSNFTQDISHPFTIGYAPIRNSGAGDRLGGKVDQVRIFSKGLSSSQVSTLYAETTPESLDPLNVDTTDTLQVLGDSSCIATYRFENNEDDLSGNYDGTGTAIQYAAGRYGQAASFNGSSSKITNTSLSVNTGQEFSISLWVYPQKDGSYQRILQFGNHATEFVIQKRGDDNKVRLLARISAAIQIDISSTVLNNNQWYHIVVTVDGSTAKLYVNNGTPATDVTFNTQNYSGLFIGCGEGDREFVEGKIDQVRIFTKALSSSEVSTLYAETVDTVESLDPLNVDTTDTLQVLGDSSCIATYRFENNEVDLSGNYDGTGTAIQYAAGRYGQAASFNGSSSYVNLGSTNQFASTAVSISMWVNPNSVTTSYALSGNGNGGSFADGDNDIFLRTDGYIGYEIGQSSSIYEARYATTTQLTVNAWHHIVVTYDSSLGTTIGKIYVNGISQSTSATYGAGGTFSGNIFIGTLNYNIGKNNYGLNFNGEIDQFRIFNKAISAAEVTTLYNENPLVASYRFEGNANDDTRNYDGTATNVTYEYGLGFTPDFVWIKDRSATRDHNITDSTRGVTHPIYIESGAELTNSTFVTSFDTGGFTLGNNATANESGEDFVAWCLKANGGTTSSNTDGTITSTVQANTDAGFSIISWTGTGSNGTIGTGLSTAADLIITKARGTVSPSVSEGWPVYHSSLPSDKILYLDQNYAQSGKSTVYQNPTTTSTTFGVETWRGINSNGVDMISYAFHSVENFSSFGSYTGNGSATSPPIIETGFEPAFVMIKNTENGSTSWAIADNKRGFADLYANSSDAEFSSGSLYGAHFLSNGFTLNTSDISRNANNIEYIYMAFAADPDTEQPTVAKSFNAVTYTGNGSTQTIDGLGFKPGLIWMKRRDTAQEHALVNTVSGTLKYLYSDLTSAEQNTTDGVSSFNDDGWTMGTNGLMNNTNNTYVGWAWKADDNEPTINTEGSIDSLVSANANAGFSIIKYTGNGVINQSIGHGLSAAPELYITKNLDTGGTGWFTKTTVVDGSLDELALNTTDAASNITNTNLPTSSVIYQYNNTNLGANGQNYIVYAFHSVSGYSKIGSYTGNGSSSGPTVTTGFQPDWIMIKRTDVSGTNWNIMDSVRGNSDYLLAANTSAAEVTNETPLNTTSTGFQITEASSYINASGGTYIYMAFKIN